MYNILIITFTYLFIGLENGDCFIPNSIVELIVKGDGTRNHFEITSTAVDNAASEFIRSNRDLYSNEISYYLNMLSYKLVRFKIATENGNVDLNLNTAFTPSCHFDDETFVGSNQQIADKRRNVINFINNSNFPNARTFLGYLLHTLQDFYSHSNWIELENTLPLNDLGTDNVRFTNLAGPSEQTCSGCGSDINGCELNLKTTKLTSGYYHTTDMNAKNEGKCSHGGSSDETRRKSAVGGINKDADDPSVSPHFTRHKEAADMSVIASTRFISNLFESLKSISNVGSFLGLYSQDNTFCYVVNVGKLAAEDLKVIGKTIINSLTRVIRYGIDFSLVTINRSGINTFSTSKFSEAVRAVQTLNNKDGSAQDNKIFAAIGLALELDITGSLNIFTDSSDATDADLFSGVLAIATDLDVSINAFIVSNLPARRKRSTTTAGDLLKKLSSATGGSSLSFQSQDASDVVSSLEKQTTEGKVTIVKITDIATPLTSFAVDSSVTKLEVVIMGSTIRSFQILDPLGTIVNSFTYLTNTNDIKILELGSPVAGTWKIVVISLTTYSLKVNGFSDINFQYTFSNLRNEPLKGRLVSNKAYFADIFCEQFITFKTISLQILSETGAQLSTFLANGSSCAYRANINVPNIAFQLKVFGQLNNLENIERVISGLLEPSKINLTLKYESGSSGSLTSGSSINLNSIIINEGSTNTFSIKIKDSKNWLTSQAAQNLSLVQGNVINLVHSFTAPSTAVSGNISNVVLSVESLDGNIENIISLSIFIYNPVADKTAPDCAITSYAPNADVCRGFSTPPSCSSKSYTAYLEAQDVGSGLSALKPQKYIDGAVFKSGVYIEGTKAKATANYTLTCCYPSVAVIALDMEANVNYCNVNMELTPLTVINKASSKYMSGYWLNDLIFIAVIYTASEI